MSRHTCRGVCCIDSLPAARRACSQAPGLPNRTGPDHLEIAAYIPMKVASEPVSEPAQGPVHLPARPAPEFPHNTAVSALRSPQDPPLLAEFGGYPRNLYRRPIVPILCRIRQAWTGCNPNRETLMKAAVARKPLIRVAVVESDPLRFVGFRALFDTEPDLELVSASLSDLSQLQVIDLVLLGNRGGQNLYDIIASMKAIRPDLRIIVTGSGMDDESVLKAIAAGAKGYVD